MRKWRRCRRKTHAEKLPKPKTNTEKPSGQREKTRVEVRIRSPKFSVNQKKKNTLTAHLSPPHGARKNASFAEGIGPSGAFVPAGATHSDCHSGVCLAVAEGQEMVTIRIRANGPPWPN